jgi:hypothetical protein
VRHQLYLPRESIHPKVAMRMVVLATSERAASWADVSVRMLKCPAMLEPEAMDTEVEPSGAAEADGARSASSSERL